MQICSLIISFLSIKKICHAGNRYRRMNISANNSNIQIHKIVDAVKHKVTLTLCLTASINVKYILFIIYFKLLLLFTYCINISHCYSECSFSLKISCFNFEFFFLAILFSSNARLYLLLKSSYNENIDGILFFILSIILIKFDLSKNKYNYIALKDQI
jgi:hypothetical protein